ncbi:unnamed protein product [Oncorhynchus mykiss]|uniref:PHR domain-containing protein n=1 Tax=Oncorhynchus mykiss TaxID=8022 RepID=A0A060XGA5_ONCMY|nr:unnamed protein product [Oncorhynchus mykiss]
MFDEPVLLQLGWWYVAWAQVSGPSSDCGSHGQATITTDDSVVFQFKSSKKSNNGTDVNAGQIPHLLYRQVIFLHANHILLVTYTHLADVIAGVAKVA